MLRIGSLLTLHAFLALATLHLVSASNEADNEGEQRKSWPQQRDYEFSSHQADCLACKALVVRSTRHSSAQHDQNTAFLVIDALTASAQRDPLPTKIQRQNYSHFFLFWGYFSHSVRQEVNIVASHIACWMCLQAHQTR
jgi:hypothetical protein